MLPTIIGAARHVRNIGSIVVINLFLGWARDGNKTGTNGPKRPALSKPFPSSESRSEALRTTRQQGPTISPESTSNPVEVRVPLIRIAESRLAAEWLA